MGLRLDLQRDVSPRPIRGLYFKCISTLDNHLFNIFFARVLRSFSIISFIFRTEYAIYGRIREAIKAIIVWMLFQSGIYCLYCQCLNSALHSNQWTLQFVFKKLNICRIFAYHLAKQKFALRKKSKAKQFILNNSVLETIFCIHSLGLRN